MSLEEFYINEVEIVSQAYDKWGNPDGPETATTEKCRIEYENKMVRNFQGEQVVSTACVFLKKNTIATAQSILRFDGRDNAILTFSKLQESDRIHHIEAYVA